MWWNVTILLLFFIIKHSVIINLNDSLMYKRAANTTIPTGNQLPSLQFYAASTCFKLIGFLSSAVLFACVPLALTKLPNKECGQLLSAHSFVQANWGLHTQTEMAESWSYKSVKHLASQEDPDFFLMSSQPSHHV